MSEIAAPPKISRNASLNVVALAGTGATGFAGSVVAAHALGPTKFAEYSYLTWLLTTLVVLIGFGMSGATERFVAELEGANQRSVANRLSLALFIMQMGLATAAGLLMAAFSPWLAGILGRPSAQPYLAVLGLGIPMAMAFQTVRARLAGFQRFDLISVASILSGLTTLGGTILLLHFGFGVRGLVWLSISVYFFQFVLIVAFQWKYRPKPLGVVSVALARRVARYCIGMSVITVCDAIIWQRSETFFLGRYSTTDQIAYYGLAYQVTVALVTMLPLALSGVLMPALSHRFGAGDRASMQHIYSQATRYVAMLGLPLSLIGLAVAEPFVSLLYGVAFTQAAQPMRILLIAAAVGAVAGPGSALFLSLGRSDLMGLLSVPIALLNVALAYVLVSRRGAVGAAVANSVCQVVGVIVGTTYLLRRERFRLPFASLSRIALAASISAGLAYLLVVKLQGWAGLLLGAGLGAITYVPALSVTGALDSSDFVLLRQMVDTLPHRLVGPLGRVVALAETASLQSRRIFGAKP